MRELEFKEYSAKVTDADGDDHTVISRAAAVDAETAKSIGDVQTRIGTQRLNDGDYVVETSRPGVYDVFSAKDWEANGFQSGDSPSGPSVNEQENQSDSEESPKTNPRKATR